MTMPSCARFAPCRSRPTGCGACPSCSCANPKACGNNGRGSELEQDVVDVHFETLGIFHDTQTVPLGIGVMAMTGPAGGC